MRKNENRDLCVTRRNAVLVVVCRICTRSYVGIQNFSVTAPAEVKTMAVSFSLLFCLFSAQKEKRVVLITCEIMLMVYDLKDVDPNDRKDKRQDEMNLV